MHCYTKLNRLQCLDDVLQICPKEYNYIYPRFGGFPPNSSSFWASRNYVLNKFSLFLNKMVDPIYTKTLSSVPFPTIVLRVVCRFKS